MVADVAHLIARDAAPERIRALVRTTVSEIESSFTTVDRLQSRTRLALTLSLLEDGTQSSPRFGPPTAGLRAELNTLDVDDRHYWISTFYTLLMSTSVRREKATYFTPPAIVRHLIRQAERADPDLKTARVIDPAAGGAAFVSSLAGRMTELGSEAGDIKSRISGIEIDPHLALLGEALVRDRLGVQRGKSMRRLIRIADSLSVNEAAKYDAVFVNPPYGRICATAAELARLMVERPNGTIDASSIAFASRSALARVAADFVLRGWLSSISTGWRVGPLVVPQGSCLSWWAQPR